MAEEHSDDRTRVGNPERERAIVLLNDAFADGYLEVAEFEDRSRGVYAARTRGELRQVLEHLPGAGRLFPDAPAAGAGIPPAVARSIDAGPLQLDATWETVRRKGIWQVPPQILAVGSMGTVDLDFTHARFLSSMVDLQLQVSTCTVKLRVGPDHEIRYADLGKSGWSSVKDKSGAPARPGGPVINLTGSISAMSGVTIRRA